MKTVFIADAHLARPADENYRQLLAFLQELSGNNTHRLVILGDLFAFWAGFRTGNYPPYRAILDALRQLSDSGMEIVYVEGNHDFHLERYFGRILGWRILPDGGVIECDGRRLFIAHGDLVNPDDRPYLRLRRLFRSAGFRWLCGIIPPAVMGHLAAWASRESSRRRPPQPASAELKAMLERYSKEMLQEGAEAVVLGHLHIPLHHQTPDGEILVLGDWISQYSYATCEQGRLSLEKWVQPLPPAPVPGRDLAG